MKSNSTFIILGLMIVGLLGSCGGNPPTEPSKGGQLEDPNVINNNEQSIPLLPDCNHNLMGDPVLVSPNNVVVDPSPPHTFKWTISCMPSHYYLGVYVARYPFTEEGSSDYKYVILTDFDAGDPEYTSDVPLDPATSYRWAMQVRASDGQNEHPVQASFTTGPVCSPEVLVAPTLISPENGSYENGKGGGNTHEVHILISYPIDTCIPEWYEIDLSLNPEFSGEDSWNVYSPGAFSALDENGQHIIEDDTNELNNCTIYYWHAWAGVGNTSGPMSETYNFYTNFDGECLPNTDFISLKNANCRSNPWIDGNEVGLLKKDEHAKLLGLNEDAFWGYFLLTNGLECWVHMSTVQIQPPGFVFDPTLYPLIAHDPLPENLPTGPEPGFSCSTITDSRDCESNSQCSWDTGSNSCKNR